MLKLTQFSAGLVLIASVLVVSCAEDAQENLPADGTINVSLTLPAEGSSSGRSLDDPKPAYLLLSIDGPSQLSMKKVRIYPFEGSYLSEAITLMEGDYQLTDFIVLDETEEVIYAAPKQGSDLEGLVSVPLPMDFSVLPGEATKLTPEVIRTLNNEASQFGYTTFGLEVVETLMLTVFGGDQFLETELQVWDGDTFVTTLALEPNTNRVALPKGQEVYTLVIEEHGFARYEGTITRTGLKEFETQPLVISLAPALTFRLDQEEATPSFNYLDINVSDAAMLYIDYAGSWPNDTLIFEGPGEISRDLVIAYAEPFVSITGDLDKIESFKNNTGLNITSINFDNVPNLKRVDLVPHEMDILSFKNGSPIQSLSLFGGTLDSLNITGLDNLVNLSLTFMVNYGTSAEEVSRQLYESLQSNPRYDGVAHFYFALAANEDTTFMELIAEEYGWDVYYEYYE